MIHWASVSGKLVIREGRKLMKNEIFKKITEPVLK